MAFASERHEEKTVRFKCKRYHSAPNITECYRSYRKITFAPNGIPIISARFISFISIFWLVSETSMCIIDPAYQEQNRQSIALTQLIHYNETKMCDILTNIVFVLLVLLLLGCGGILTALCVNPTFFGIKVYNDTTQSQVRLHLWNFVYKVAICTFMKYNFEQQTSLQ